MGTITEAIGRMRRFLKREQGSVAVEFALLAPLMIAIFILIMEMAQAIDVSRKLGRMTVQIGDLITQQAEVKRADIQSIALIGRATMQPYRKTVPAVRVTAIDITTGNQPKATVAWSRCYNSCSQLPAFAKGAEVPLAEELLVPGMFLVRVETELNYQPIVAWSEGAKKLLGLMALDNIVMSETVDHHPRISTKIPCSDC